MLLFAIEAGGPPDSVKKLHQRYRKTPIASHTHCLLLFAIEAGSLLDPVKNYIKVTIKT